MPFPAEHMLLQFGGTLGTSGNNPPETWNCTLRFYSDVLAAIDNDTIHGEIWGRLQQLWATSTVGPSDIARLSFSKWNRIGLDGRYASDEESRVQALAIGLNAGTRPIHYNPWQTSLVVTLHTNKARGLASKGRIFLPVPSAPVDNNQGLVDEAWAAGVGQAWGGFLSDLSANVFGVGSGPVIMSKGRNKGTGPGAMEYVTGVSVGRRLDVMRSRANKIRDVGTRVPVN